MLRTQSYAGFSVANVFLKRVLGTASSVKFWIVCGILPPKKTMHLSFANLNHNYVMVTGRLLIMFVATSFRRRESTGTSCPQLAYQSRKGR